MFCFGRKKTQLAGLKRGKKMLNFQGSLLLVVGESQRGKTKKKNSN